MVERIFAHLD